MDMLWPLLLMTRKNKEGKKTPKICLIAHFFLPVLFPASLPPTSWIA